MDDDDDERKTKYAKKRKQPSGWLRTPDNQVEKQTEEKHSMAVCCVKS